MASDSTATTLSALWRQRESLVFGRRDREPAIVAARPPDWVVRMRIRWTRYRFVHPERWTEETFLLARLYPRAFLAARWREVEDDVALNAGRVVLAAVIVVLGQQAFGSGWLDDMTPILSYPLVLGGVALLASCVLSALSYVGYLVSAGSYWSCFVLRARSYDDAGEFWRAQSGNRRGDQSEGNAAVPQVPPTRRKSQRMRTLGRRWIKPVLAAVGVLSAIVVVSVAASLKSQPSPAPSAPTRIVGPPPSGQLSAALEGIASANGSADQETPTPVAASNVPGPDTAAVVAPTRPHAPEPPSLAPTDNDDASVRVALRKGINQAFDEAIDLLSDYRLSKTVHLRAHDCGDSRSVSYDPSSRTVLLCYRFVMHTFSEAERDGSADPVEYARDVARFAIAHELGHALIDIYRLPVLGREEDAADQFAAYMFLEHGRPVPVLAAAQRFAAGDLSAGTDFDALRDEHALDQQRVANLTCWLVGNAPEENAILADNLPASRLARCPSEFAQLRTSWKRLLAPHRRER